MPESTLAPSSSPSSSNINMEVKVHKKIISSSWPNFLATTFLLTVLLPVLLATLVYQLDPFDPAPIPVDEFNQDRKFIPRQNVKMLQGSEKVGVGELMGPEDMAYDAKSKVLYTGCADGWVKRVTVADVVADSVVESWVNTGGRPLGLAVGVTDGEVIVADADKGLLKISKDGEITLLTDEADGLKLRLTDGVAVAKNGMIYFTDASHKYNYSEHLWDVLEGRPHGRFLSYDPSTKQTKVLARDLYFANGVSLSPDEEFVIFCESPLRKCNKYYIQGEREGSVDVFTHNLFGVPDNIRYDGDGRYWIGVPMEYTYVWHLALKYPVIRKVIGIMEKYVGRPQVEKNGGVIAVDLEGNPTELYIDHELSVITGGIKIGEHLYLGSLAYPYLIRLNLTRYPAVASTSA